MTGVIPSVSKVLYERDGRIARIMLNRPQVLNAIDDDVPRELAAAVERTDTDEGVHVIVLAAAVGAGYDLMHYAQSAGANRCTQDMPTPVRVWGCPTTAMWLLPGAREAKRMLFSGDKIDGREAEKLRLVLKAVPADRLDEEADALSDRIASMPQNQLMNQTLMVNQALANMGLHTTQMIGTLFDGITRHTREGLNFKRCAAEQGWKQAVVERDQGTFDWTRYQPFASHR